MKSTSDFVNAFSSQNLAQKLYIIQRNKIKHLWFSEKKKIPNVGNGKKPFLLYPI